MLGKFLRSAFAGVTRRISGDSKPGVSQDAQSISQLMRDGAQQAKQGSWDAAEQTYRQVLQLAPDNADALYSLGVVYGRKREYAAATHCLEQVVADQPHHIEAINALGNIARFQHRWEEAGRHYTRALDLQPGFVSALSNLGLCLKNEGKPQAGIVYLERAFELQPDAAAIVLNYALGLLDLGRQTEGEAHLLRALRLDPNLAEAHAGLAMLHLAKGRFAEGWREYEWRMYADEWEPQLQVDCPVWTGSPLAGRVVLVRAEQGLGDQLMFASCLSEIVAQSRSCVVECDVKLKKLFGRSFPSARIYAYRQKGVPGWVADEVKLDLQVQLGSLPHRLQRDWGNFPQHRGYLRADPERVSAWRARLDGLGTGLKVGISWRGGTKKTRQAARSVPLSEWMPVLKRQAHWISLQYGECEGEIGALARAQGVTVHHWREAIDDYDETAALVSALDLVVSVQTAIVHLAGALGQRVWVLVPASPEWRYLDRGETMPWYPAVRLFRQAQPGDWRPLIERVADEVRDLSDASYDAV